MRALFKRLFISLLLLNSMLFSGTDFIAGEALYTNSELLPEHAEFEVTLSNVSLMDIEAEVLGKQTIKDAGQIPVAFKIEFDDSAIRLGERYAVSAKITHNGKLLYISDTMNPVFAGNDNKNLRIVMKQVGKVPETRIMDGMYKYMADAAMFKDCVTGKYYPVAFEGDSSALEKAYLEEVNGSNFYVKVELKGKIVKGAKIEGVGEEDTLLVEQFIRISGLKDCTEQHASVPITNNYWKLVELYREEVKTGADENEAHILLKNGLNGAGALKVVTGCRTILGDYKLNEQIVDLNIKSVKDKNTDCKYASLEKDFLAALDNTSYWRIEGETLTLLDEMDNILAIFHAIYF